MAKKPTKRQRQKTAPGEDEGWVAALFQDLSNDADMASGAADQKPPATAEVPRQGTAVESPASRKLHMVLREYLADLGLLTPQERAVLASIGGGYKSSSEFANIKESTVRWHLWNIKKKLGVETRGDLIFFQTAACCAIPTVLTARIWIALLRDWRRKRHGGKTLQNRKPRPKNGGP